MNREDFAMLEKNDIIYFDNGATTLKPRVLGETISDYYNHYSANAHRGDYDISLKVDAMYENARELVKDFINAEKTKEISFTAGSTDSLNRIIFGYCKQYLQKGDEVLITKSEHASNVLPWFELATQIGIVIKYIPLTEGLQVTMENVKQSITEKTKVISLAHITNVVGDIRPIKEITKYAHEKDIVVIVDGAQSVPHMPVDVQDLDIDFLAFSAHKMCGPTGLGVLYGKEKWLEQTVPLFFGGGMNASFEPEGTRVYHDIPTRFEAGTPNIAGVIGFGSIISYLDKIGMPLIHQKELELCKYAKEKLKEIENIKIYNEESTSGIIAFNIEGIFSQDLAVYLNKYNICVRAGNHCAKILKGEMGIKNTCRMSFYFYNTKEEIDKVIDVLKNPHIKEEII
ncbi:MAG: cysteine desulfurase [Bacilli bacterium]|nr:cysteine desulfurase [Bacilli bacterium]